MNKKRRLEKILDMLKIDGTITIKEIIDELDISDMTARRDLDALEADGLLTRIHGGAQLLSSKKPLDNRWEVLKVNFLKLSQLLIV